MATNAQILSAILGKWATPMAAPFLSSWVEGVPALGAIQNKVRSMGWVSPNWSLVSELSPLLEGASGYILTPIISSYLAGLDDEGIPAMVHGIVDKAVEHGNLSLMEGKVIIERADLQHLKRLLDANLPYTPGEHIHITE